MSSQQALYLALDQGGGSSRALVIDAAGRVLSRAQVPVATRRPQPGWVEQDPEALVASLRRAALDALAPLSGAARDRLTAWGLVCQRASLVCWDKVQGTPLTPVLSWQDTRGAGSFRLSGEQRRYFRRLNGLYPSAHHGAGKFRWCLEHIPAVRRAAVKGSLVMSPLAGYLMASLTGSTAAPAVDPVSAQRTLLWGQAENDWHDELLQAFGLKRAWFPALRPNDAHWGEALLGGLKLPARFLGGDQSAALYGSGPSTPGEVTINLGTGAFATLPLESSHPGELPLLYSLILDRGGRRCWALEATVHGGGAALDWLREHLGLQFDDKRLGAWLQSVKHPALFINGVGGLGSPYWRPRLESRFVGPENAPARAVGVLESVLFLLQINLELLATVMPLKRLRLGGGLARIEGLPQRLASLSGYPVLPAPETESTALGLGWLLAHPGGQALDPQRSALEQAPSLPQPDQALQGRYRRWRRCLAYELKKL